MALQKDDEYFRSISFSFLFSHVFREQSTFASFGRELTVFADFTAYGRLIIHLTTYFLSAGWRATDQEGSKKANKKGFGKKCTYFLAVYNWHGYLFENQFNKIAKSLKQTQGASFFILLCMYGFYFKKNLLLHL